MPLGARGGCFQPLPAPVGRRMGSLAGRKVFGKKEYENLAEQKESTTFARADCKRRSAGRFFRGVAQLVAFLVWDQAVAGSSPVTPTIR